jgi:hypothetical protein
MLQNKFAAGVKKKMPPVMHIQSWRIMAVIFRSLDKHKSINPQVCMMQIQGQSHPICTSAVKLIQLYIQVLTKTVTFYSTHFAYITDIYTA